MKSAAEKIAPDPRKALDQGFVTEAEAVKRFCPHQRVVWSRERDDGGYATIGSVAFNMARHERSEIPNTTARCVASMCMSWRWSPNGESGFCGLAGRPI